MEARQNAERAFFHTVGSPSAWWCARRDPRGLRCRARGPGAARPPRTDGGVHVQGGVWSDIHTFRTGLLRACPEVPKVGNASVMLREQEESS
eukprot:886269-Prymnesium_polylepis.1